MRKSMCSFVSRTPRAKAGTAAFTLVELLVVISIISLLVSIIMPALGKARALARDMKCLTMVSAQLKGVYMYASQASGLLPVGSDNPLKYAGQGTLPPISSLATFQFWLGLNQEYTGLGTLLDRRYITHEVLFCPRDDKADPSAEYKKAYTSSTDNAWGSYLYRQLDGQAGSPPRRRLENLGNNARGRKVSVLILDAQCTMVWAGLPLKSNHNGEKCSVGLASGTVTSVTNDGARLTLSGNTSSTYQRLDQILETADALCPGN